MEKICKLVNDQFSWVMYVDNEKIQFDGFWNADYFAKHYENFTLLMTYLFLKTL